MEKHRYRDLLSQKEFLKLLVADLISRFGDSVDAIAYSWLMFEITKSESLMALIIGLNYVPTVLLQPLTGALVDRMNKRRVMVVTDLLRFVIVGLLVGLYTYGQLTPVGLAVLTLCTSTVEAFRIPAGSAITLLLLEPSHYTVGKAASFSLQRTFQLLGFVVSGALIAWIGSAGALMVDAVSFLLSALLIFGIRVVEKRATKAVDWRQIPRDFKDGLAFWKGSQTVQVLSIIGLVINFGLMPLSVFQTPYVSEYLKMGAEVLSYIKVLLIVGMMLGAFAAPRLLRWGKGRLAVLAGIGMGGFLLGLHFPPYLPLLWGKMGLLTLSMLVVGIGGGILNVIIGSTMMAAVPQAMMGRVSALNAAIMQASMPVGSFLCSALVLKLNIPQLFALFGAATIVFYLLLGLFRYTRTLDVKR